MKYGKPFLSWALIVRNCAKTLEATLKSLKERTPNAEIVIVDTCSSDEGATREIARRYANVYEVYHGPRGDWDEKMPAFDDAAAARNRSFELATGSWVGWIDSDDVLPGPAEAEKLLKENGRWHPGKEAKIEGLADVVAPMGLEEVIRQVTAARPEIACLYAPYLYRRNADGTAAEWQERERFVRNDGSWHWQGKGHEVLVPKNGGQPGATIGVLSSLLFVHMKEWNNEDYIFSVTRHFNALIKEYDQGDRSHRTCMYLENFSKLLCPQRRSEFLQAAYENSFTPLDRCRSLMRAGEFAAEQGFFMDALEAFSGATALRPDLPDPWLTGATVFERAEDWARAAEWYERGATRSVNAIESLMNPRDLLIGFPAKAAECWRRAMKKRIDGRVKFPLDAGAYHAATRRKYLLENAYKSEAAGPDKEVLGFLFAHAENDEAALEAANKIHWLWNYLVRNEETAKAAQLVKLAPHTMEDFPEMADLRAWAAKVDRHLTDPDAYVDFYNSPECGAEFDHLMFEKPALPRVRFLIDWIKANKPDARILEVGCFDGSVGIHVLRECPGVTYFAVDAMENALKHFEDRAIKEGLADRLNTFLGMDLEEITEKSFSAYTFDVIVFYEIIEHVPNPRASLKKLRSRLRPDGHLFVSTPWGAFDRGRPYNLPVRDPRGHVRAMTARELFDVVEAAGFRVETMNGANGVSGATLHLAATRRTEDESYPIHFFVPSALWDWNASHLIETGMGASEETIVYLARELARDMGEKVSVYGPVPENLPCVSEEVHSGVGYWTRAKVNEAKPGGLIVSRSPSSGRMIDPDHVHDRILWLQDTIYPDLNEETAKDYRKIVTLTGWHRDLIAEQVGRETGRLVIIPNFLIPSHFRKEGQPLRLPHHFIYASSPDRGLIRLLKMWPAVRAVLPDATLDIFYGWEGCMKLGTGNTPGWTRHYRQVRTDYMALRYQPGVRERGRVNHEVLAREFQQATAWLYPTHFAEAGCLTAAKARAGGCIPVTTPYAALKETADCPLTQWVEMPGVGVVEDPTGTPEAFERYTKQFVGAVLDAVEVEKSDREDMSSEAIDEFDVVRIAKYWRTLLDE